LIKNILIDETGKSTVELGLVMTIVAIAAIGMMAIVSSLYSLSYRWGRLY